MLDPTRLTQGSRLVQRSKIGSFLGYTGGDADFLAQAAHDPNVWSGRASQEVFIDLSDPRVLHQCIRPLLQW